jgi:prophage antirepressor-like protein
VSAFVSVIKWVASEVLPIIRKTGQHISPGLNPAQQREVQKLVCNRAFALSGNENPERHHY